MHHYLWAICATLTAGAPANAEQSTSPVAVRMLRVEGAAVDVRRAAEKVEELSKKISNSKILSDFTALHTQLNELHKVVASARLAVSVAQEELGPKTQ